VKVSYDWLNDFVDLSSSDVNTVADKLTMRAFEVEDIELVGDALEGEVVLAEIKEIKKHPDADKLNVTQTCIGKNPDGSENIQQIVCGASNIAVGQKVPVATVGSKVFNRKDGTQLEIKKAKIRGVESFGMICSPDELGLPEAKIEKIRKDQGDGIYVLYNPETKVDLSKGLETGGDIRKILGMKSDHIINVGARSNRGDALSILGQAREISAILGEKLIKKAPQEITSSKTFTVDKSIKQVKPEIEDPKDCKVFHTLTIEGLTVCESPDWLKQRLESMGTRAINSLVDISNYVLLELGQPMHFYDRDKLENDTLTVRRAKPGEQIKTLEDKVYELSETNLLISDGKIPVCVAGAMGGFDSQITEETKNLVIEAAAFNAASVRRSARFSGIESESKKRFERGVDPSSTKSAILRALELIALIAEENGHNFKIGEILTAGNAAVEEKTIELSLKDVKRHLGIEIEKKDISSYLSSLEFTVNETKPNILDVKVPSFRVNDVSRAEDLIEEIARLHGYDNIPAMAPSTSVSAEPFTSKEKISNNLKHTLISFGFSLATLSSLVGDTLTGKENTNSYLAKIFDQDKEIKMDNPLSREHSVLRQSMIPGLIQAASRNFAYDKSKNIKLFELGKTYFLNDKIKSGERTTPSSEIDKIGAIMISTNNSWDLPKAKEEDFFKFKAIVENLYPRAVFKHISEEKDFKFAAICHPGIASVIYEDKREVGYMAKLHPSLTKEWDLPENTFIFEANFPKAKKEKFKAVPSTPIMERDITADLASDISSAQIEALMKKTASKDLVEITIVSLYKKTEDAPEKSLSYRLKWQSPTETLSGEAIDKEVEAIKDILSKELGAKFRA
jgi:phenylalanyl-tRNA synthetase beta chain